MCSKFQHLTVFRRIMSSPPHADNADDFPGENREIIIENPDSVSRKEPEIAGAERAELAIGTSGGDHEQGKDELLVAEEKQTDDVATGSSGKGTSSGGENNDNQIAENDDGFRTPTSPGHKIPTLDECPPAPRKPWPPKLKRKSSPPRASRSLRFEEPPEVESIFRALPDDDHQESSNADETKNKKPRRAEED